MNPNISELEKSIGYSFRDGAVLREALTHKSYYHENPSAPSGHNERLEFLGDSVLGLIVVESLHGSDGKLAESIMSKIKSYVVRGVVLSEMAKEISLGDYILLGKGEEETGGRNKRSVLANAMEALIGALYIDAGYSKTREFVLGFLKARIEEAVSSGDFHDYKTELQEICQMRFGTLPVYRIAGEEGEEHDKVFTVEVYFSGKNQGTGRGRSKKEAETEAAREALSHIK